MALLTAEDILNKQFTATKFREGYDIEEVDDFLDEVVRTLSTVQEENADLKAKLDAAERRVAELSRDGAAAAFTAPAAVVAEPVTQAAPVVEPETPNTADQFQRSLDLMVITQKNATELLDNAKREAAATVEAANNQAASTRSEAKDESIRLVSDARAESARIISDAEATAHRTLTQLEQERSVLDRKIDELRVFERDSRTRMKSFLQNLLNDVESKGQPVQTNPAATV